MTTSAPTPGKRLRWKFPLVVLVFATSAILALHHREWVESYIAAYVEALRWALQPSNREASIGILMQTLKIPREVAQRTYRMLADPARGFTPDAKFDLEGFKNMLALRAEMEGGQGSAPQKYFDLSYYERALAALQK